VGPGFGAYPALRDRLAAYLSECDPALEPGAATIGVLGLRSLAAGEACDARDAAPLYVRHRVALTSAERESGMAL